LQPTGNEIAILDEKEEKEMLMSSLERRNYDKK